MRIRGSGGSARRLVGDVCDWVFGFCSVSLVFLNGFLLLLVLMIFDYAEILLFEFKYS